MSTGAIRNAIGLKAAPWRVQYQKRGQNRISGNWQNEQRVHGNLLGSWFGQLRYCELKRSKGVIPNFLINRRLNFSELLGSSGTSAMIFDMKPWRYLNGNDQ
jgi:hypothetical protein